MWLSARSRKHRPVSEAVPPDAFHDAKCRGEKEAGVDEGVVNCGTQKAPRIADGDDSSAHAGRAEPFLQRTDGRVGTPRFVAKASL